MDKVTPDINKYAGQLIRTLRIRHELSGRELGDMLGMSQQQISRYENAKSDISLKTLTKFAEIFNYTLLQFIAEMSVLLEKQTQTVICENKITTELFNSTPYFNLLNPNTKLRH